MALLERGVIAMRDVEVNRRLFGLGERLFERRLCPQGVMTQTFAGAARKGTGTTQDHLPIYEKTSSDYFRARHRLETPAEHVSALAFVMDMGTSFIPLVHSGSSLMEAGVQSSLDFALRIVVNGGEGGVDLNEWNLRELSTVSGGEGRTYTEARVWVRQWEDGLQHDAAVYLKAQGADGREAEDLNVLSSLNVKSRSVRVEGYFVRLQVL